QKLPEASHIALTIHLGTCYAQAGSYADAKRCWKVVMEKDPKNAAIRQHLFELAVDNKDEKLMGEIVDELFNSRNFGVNSSLYKYCAATRLIAPVNSRHQGKHYNLDDTDKKALAQARKLIDEAIAGSEGVAGRPEWNVLWRVRGEINQLESNTDAAIAAYQRALDCNRTGQATTGRRLVQLLYLSNRIGEANEALKYIGPGDVPDNMKVMIEDIRFKAGGVDTALASAKANSEKDPK